MLTLDRVDPSAFPWPGLPGGVAPRGWNGWTAGAIRVGAEALAEVYGCSVEETWDWAQVNAQGRVTAAAFVEHQLAQEVTHLREARMLGPDELTERVMRYEAHLQRQMSRDLAQLELLQNRRRGTPSPLLRLEVTGLET